jgi:hypothetical protein
LVDVSRIRPLLWWLKSEKGGVFPPKILFSRHSSSKIIIKINIFMNDANLEKKHLVLCGNQCVGVLFMSFHIYRHLTHTHAFPQKQGHGVFLENPFLF